MTRFRHTIAAALGLVALTSTLAAAQRGDYPVVRPGQPVEGVLDAESPRFVDGKAFRVYQFQAQPGRRYVATMSSSEFDAYLVLARANGGITEYIKQDDDGGEGINARLRFTVPIAGTYLLIARGLSAQARGPFSVGLEDAGEIVVPAPVPLRVGQTVEGSLSDTDGFLDESERNYDLYVVRGDPGEDVYVMLASPSFDTYLEAGELVDGTFQQEQSNDDYRGRDSALQLRLGRRGEAFVRATSLSGNQVGAYTISAASGRLPAREDTAEAQIDIAAPANVP
jgi:hypothetical protein